MQFLNRVTDLVIINLFVFAFFLPAGCLFFVLGGLLPLTALSIGISLLTPLLGSALTAMHYCVLKMVRSEDAYPLRSFFRSYRDNFKQATPLFLIFLVCYGVLFADLRILQAAEGTWVRVMYMLAFGGLIVVTMMFLYAFPLQARFDNPIRQTLKNAFLLSVYALPRTLLMLLMHAAVLILAAYVGIRIFPLILFIAFSGIAYLSALLYSPVFRRFEGEEDAPEEDAPREENGDGEA